MPKEKITNAEAIFDEIRNPATDPFMVVASMLDKLGFKPEKKKEKPADTSDSQ